MSLTKADLVELKSLKSPPRAVVTVWTAVMILMGYPQQQAKEWKIIQRFIAQPDTLEKFKSFDKSKVAPEIVAMATEVLAGLSIEEVMKVNMAAGSLFKWEWTIIQRFMAQPDTMEKILSFDKSKLAPEIVAMATEVLAGLSIEEVMKVNMAAGSLFKWVHNEALVTPR